MEGAFNTLPAGELPPCPSHLGRAEFRGWGLLRQLGGWKLDIMSHTWFLRSQRQVPDLGLHQLSTAVIGMMMCAVINAKESNRKTFPLFYPLFPFMNEMVEKELSSLIPQYSTGQGDYYERCFHSTHFHPSSSRERQQDSCTEEVLYGEGTMVYLRRGWQFIFHKPSPSQV